MIFFTFLAFSMTQFFKTERNIYKLRNEYARGKTLFSDDKFKSDDVLDANGNCNWVRPPEILASPTFASSYNDTHYFQKGPMSGEPFATVAMLLWQKRDLWKYVVADDQSFDDNYGGMFLFRLWEFGIVKSIVVDDLLPFDSITNKWKLTSVVDNGDLWCTLLEKAYAKHLGGYDRLLESSMADTMADLLGCAVHQFELNSSRFQILKILKNTLDRNGVVVGKIRDCSEQDVEFAEIIHNGVTSCLIITSIFSSCDENCNIDWYLTIMNPRANHNTLNEELQQESTLSTYGNLDTFQININHFLQIFDHILVGLFRFPGLLNLTSLSGNWEIQLITGKLRQCLEDEVNMLNEPLMRMAVNYPDADDRKRLCTVYISLIQSSKCSFESDEQGKSSFKRIRLTVLGLRGYENCLNRLPVKALTLAQPIVKTSIYRRREINVQLRLEPGQYLIIPEVDFNCQTEIRRFHLTLFSSELVSVLNCVRQKYGHEYLCPLELSMDAPQFALIGLPIEVAIRFSNLPPFTRYTIRILLTFSRTSLTQPREKVIKARFEHIEICQTLMDKKLVLNVFYHEYVQFPIHSEEFVARCSAYINEIDVELKCHKVVRTILPQIKMTIDNKIYEGRCSLVAALLHNTLPFSIQAAMFHLNVIQTAERLKLLDIPPFSTAWVTHTLKCANAGCHKIRILFTSAIFRRSVAANLQVLGDPLKPSPLKSDSLHEEVSSLVECSSRGVIVCCNKHKVAGDTLNSFIPKWNVSSPPEDESPENMIYCVLAKESTFECLISDELE